MSRKRVLGCGTEAGYQYHRQHKEPSCAACKRAHSDYNRARLGHFGPVAELKPHGTNAAYVRHWRHGEYPCDECREFNRRKMTMYRKFGRSA